MSFAFWHPRYWPRWVRRVFLLTFPASVLAWVVLGAFLMGMAMAHTLWQPIRGFWSAPQRFRHSYGYYEHRPRSDPTPDADRNDGIPLGSETPAGMPIPAE